MSETTVADSTPKTPAASTVARTPASIAVRTVLLALGILGAMRIGEILGILLVPSVGEALAARAAADAVGAAGSAATDAAAAGTSVGGAAGIAESALVALLHALVLAPVALRARVGGWRLTLALGGAYLLIVWVLNEIEAAVFLGAIMPEGYALATGIAQGVTAIAAGGLATFLLGPRPTAPEPRHAPLLDRGWPLRRRVARVVAACVVYFVLYFLAGIFIALRDPELQAFYDSIGMPAPGAVAALQLGRGAIWTGVVALLLWALDAGRGAAAVIVALVCSVLMASALIPANPFLPPEIQATHFVEIASSNFLFGLAATRLLSRQD